MLSNEMEKNEMTQNYTLLADNDGRHSVVLGHDDTVHLVWDDLTVRLCPLEFMQLEQLLEEGVVDLELEKISDGRFYLQQPQLCQYRLALGQLELKMDLPDFLKLVKLTYKAVRHQSFCQLMCRYRQVCTANRKDEGEDVVLH
jgi:hypothetical protein